MVGNAGNVVPAPALAHDVEGRTRVLWEPGEEHLEQRVDVRGKGLQGRDAVAGACRV